jgi:hypothetical protein
LQTLSPRTTRSAGQMLSSKLEGSNSKLHVPVQLIVQNQAGDWHVT